MQPTRRCEARGHSTSAEQLVCHCVLDGSAAGHTGVSASGLGETGSNQANTRPRKYRGRACSICQEKQSSLQYQAFCLFRWRAAAASCMWRVISNPTRPTARHSRYTSGRSTACHGWPLIEVALVGTWPYADLSSPLLVSWNMNNSVNFGSESRNISKLPAADIKNSLCTS